MQGKMVCTVGATMNHLTSPSHLLSEPLDLFRTLVCLFYCPEASSSKLLCHAQLKYLFQVECKYLNWAVYDFFKKCKYLMHLSTITAGTKDTNKIHPVSFNRKRNPRGDIQRKLSVAFHSLRELEFC